MPPTPPDEAENANRPTRITPRRPPRFWRTPLEPGDSRPNSKPPRKAAGGWKTENRVRGFPGPKVRTWGTRHLGHPPVLKRKMEGVYCIILRLLLISQWVVKRETDDLREPRQESNL